MPDNSCAYAISYGNIMQEFIKLTKDIKEIIEGLIEPGKDSTKYAPMNNSKSNTKISVTPTNVL